MRGLCVHMESPCARAAGTPPSGLTRSGGAKGSEPTPAIAAATAKLVANPGPCDDLRLRAEEAARQVVDSLGAGRRAGERSV